MEKNTNLLYLFDAYSDNDNGFKNHFIGLLVRGSVYIIDTADYKLISHGDMDVCVDYDEECFDLLEMVIEHNVTRINCYVQGMLSVDSALMSMGYDGRYTDEQKERAFELLNNSGMFDAKRRVGCLKTRYGMTKEEFWTQIYEGRAVQKQG